MITDVTTGTDNKLEQNAVAAARLAISLEAVPVGSKHRTKLFLLHTARSSRRGEARAGKAMASTRVPYFKRTAMVGFSLSGDRQQWEILRSSQSGQLITTLP